MIGVRNMRFADVSVNMTNKHLKYWRGNPFSHHHHVYDQNGMYNMSMDRKSLLNPLKRRNIIPREIKAITRFSCNLMDLAKSTYYLDREADF